MKKILYVMLALVLAIGIVVPMVATATAVAAPNPGTICTTDSTGTAVNENQYVSKQAVYLSGHGLPDGFYYIKVTAPNGDLLGYSTTAIAEVSGGRFVTNYQIWAYLVRASDGTPGYDDTTNNGGVYKVWVSKDADFPNNASKTDNFKIVALPAESLEDPVKIDTGYVSGALIGEPGNEINIFRGIPYAAPPVGELRWRPPQPAAPWTGVRECTTFSKSAPQSATPNPSQSEDCLYLNVLTPAQMSNEKLPVMVYMHGGAYTSLSGNDAATENNYALPQHGVVVVTVNMRLGPIGLFAHPLLTEESPDDVSGNYMFLDMIAALQWVQRNIAAFGGNPDNVTIFGESGGGAKVSTLIISPLARGLFSKAICESGTSFAPNWWPGSTLARMEGLGQRLFEILGVDDEPDPLAAARAISWDQIIAANNQLTTELNPPGSPPDKGLVDVAVDGWLMPDFPLDLTLEGRVTPVRLITHANLGELTGPGSGPFPSPQLIPAYVKMHIANNQVGGKGWAMIFDHVNLKWRGEGGISTHTMEVQYVFGDMTGTSYFWLITWYLGLAGGAIPLSPPPVVLTDIDYDVSEMMMQMWTQFAKTGAPNVEGLTPWPVYTAATDEYLYVRDGSEVKSGFSEVAQTP